MTLNFVVDLISAIVGLGLVLTGLIMYFALPPGSRQQALWGLGRHDWGDMHAWLALAIVGLVLLHVALHWSWVCAYVYRAATRNPQAAVPARANLYGIVLALAVPGLLAAFVFLSERSVNDPYGIDQAADQEQLQSGPAETSGRGHGDAPRTQAGRQAIIGSTSLAQAAALTGQTPTEIKQRLAVPAETPDTTRLREIADAKGWSMSELRSHITQGTLPGQPSPPPSLPLPK